MMNKKTRTVRKNKKMKPNSRPGEKRKKKKEKNRKKEENATLPTSTVLYIIITIIK